MQTISLKHVPIFINLLGSHHGRTGKNHNTSEKSITKVCKIIRNLTSNTIIITTNNNNNDISNSNITSNGNSNNRSKLIYMLTTNKFIAILVLYNTIVTDRINR